MTPESDISVFTPYVVITDAESSGFTGGAVCSFASLQAQITKILATTVRKAPRRCHREKHASLITYHSSLITSHFLINLPLSEPLLVERDADIEAESILCNQTL